MNKTICIRWVRRAMVLVVALVSAAGVTASENTIDYSYQVWDGLGYGEPLIVRTPIVVTTMPESQFGAIFAPVRPVQMTQASVEEINLAVSCDFRYRIDYGPSNVMRLTVEAGQAQCPGDSTGDMRIMVADLILDCAVKVAKEQLVRYAPGQSPRFVLRLHWGAGDERNRETAVPPSD